MKSRLLNTLIRCCLLLALSAVRSQACAPGSSSITTIPTLGGSSFTVYSVNAAGQVTGFSYLPGNMGVHAYLYGGGNTADLGSLGGAVSIGYGVNSSGVVVGQSSLTGDMLTHAFLFNGGPSLVDLGTLGGSFSSAIDINDAGQVTGTSTTANDAANEAFFYSNGSMIEVGDLGGGGSQAVAINQRGTVIGDSFTVNFDSRGFIWTNGVIRDLGTLGGSDSTPYALNNFDMVTGESSLTNGDTHAFLYIAGVMTDLGTLGGTSSSGVAINDAGQVAGNSNTLGDTNTHAFLYANGSMQDLGTLGGYNSTASAINNLGEVVGYTSTADGSSHAFLWNAGTMVDLNTLLPTNSGWQLTAAQFINDSNQIVGYGVQNGVSQWFLMTLAPSNSSPVAVAGPDQTVQCHTNVTLDASGSSDPDGDALTFEWRSQGAVLGTNVTLTTSFPLGTNVVILTVTDPCGASSQSQVNVRVVDTTPPTGTCPPDVTASADANGQAAVTNFVPLVVASDNCTPTEFLQIAQSPLAGTLVGLGAHQVTIFVSDTSGNTSTCSVVFTVLDRTPPVILSAPASVTASAGLNCQAVVPNVLGSVVAFDNCTPANQLVLSQSPLAGASVSSGDSFITVTVADASSNSTTARVTLHVVDTTAPTILSAPVSLTVPADAGCHGTVPNVVSNVVATDNCTPAGQLTITQNPPAGALVGLGQQVLVITVTDAAGNFSTRNVSLTVVDTTPPVLVSLPPAQTVPVGANGQGAVPDVTLQVAATDNCTPASQLLVAQSPAAGTLLPPGQYTITVTVTDAAGNPVSGHIPLQVTGTGGPVITSVTVNPSVIWSPNHQMVPVTVSVVVSDNSDPAPLSSITCITSNETLAPGEAVITGPLTASLAASRNPQGSGRIYTLTVRCVDASGNSSTGNVQVLVPKSSGNGGTTGTFGAHTHH